MAYHKIKLHELLKELAAEFVELESNRTSLITVTGIEMAPNESRGTIFVTVLPTDKEDAAIEFMNRRSRDFKNFLKTKARIRTLPLMRFEIDHGEKNRQRIDELIYVDKDDKK
jgi:ribosome-binding factor A